MAGGKWKLEHTRGRLMSKIRITDSGCWEWQGFVNPYGYGMTSYRGRRGTLAHRAMYVEFRGEIPVTMTLDHLCHNSDLSCPQGPSCTHRRCVNPDHLDPVSAVVNTARAGHGRKTHCPRKHAYDESNTRTIAGRRFCIKCQQDKDRDRRLAGRK